MKTNKCFVKGIELMHKFKNLTGIIFSSSLLTYRSDEALSGIKSDPILFSFDGILFHNGK